jgi:hypothetical protein
MRKPFVIFYREKWHRHNLTALVFLLPRVNPEDDLNKFEAF